MRALVWTGDELVVEQRPRPRIGPQEALVEVELAGVCSTDLEIARGYMGFTGTLGHEFVGVVETGRLAGLPPASSLTILSSTPSTIRPRPACWERPPRWVPEAPMAFPSFSTRECFPLSSGFPASTRSQPCTRPSRPRSATPEPGNQNIRGERTCRDRDLKPSRS